MLISNPSKRLQKTHAKKVINERVTEKWSLTTVLLVITVCKRFLPLTFWGEFFALPTIPVPIYSQYMSFNCVIWVLSAPSLDEHYE
jgi:hypothetical protein